MECIPEYPGRIRYKDLVKCCVNRGVPSRTASRYLNRLYPFLVAYEDGYYWKRYTDGRSLEVLARESDKQIGELIADSAWVANTLDLGFAVAFQNYKKFLKELVKVQKPAEAKEFVDQYFRSYFRPLLLEALALNVWRYRSKAQPEALDNYLPGKVIYSPTAKELQRKYGEGVEPTV